MPGTVALTYSQIVDLWVSAGGSKTVAPMMAAIAMVESGGHPDAWNNCPHHNNQAPCSPGDNEDSRGLWQINIAPGANTQFKSWNLFNAATNAKAAVTLYDADGFAPWYSDIASGKVTKYLPGGKVSSSTVGDACGVPPVAQKQMDSYKGSYVGPGSPDKCNEICKAYSGGQNDCCAKYCGLTKDASGNYNYGTSGTGCGPGGIIPSTLCTSFGTIFSDVGFAFVILGGGLLIILGLALLGIDLRKGASVSGVVSGTRQRRTNRNTQRQRDNDLVEYGEHKEVKRQARAKDRVALKNAPNAARRKKTRIVKKDAPKGTKPKYNQFPEGF